jgi:hypothetical protein
MFRQVEKIIVAKPGILIKIRLHHRIPCNKLFKQDPHEYILIFFDKYFISRK